jgi:hypothetical protein
MIERRRGTALPGQYEIPCSPVKVIVRSWRNDGGNRPQFLVRGSGRGRASCARPCRRNRCACSGVCTLRGRLDARLLPSCGCAFVWPVAQVCSQAAAWRPAFRLRQRPPRTPPPTQPETRCGRDACPSISAVAGCQVGRMKTCLPLAA